MAQVVPPLAKLACCHPLATRSDPCTRNGHEGHEGHEGDEGDEGHEGHEGHEEEVRCWSPSCYAGSCGMRWFSVPCRYHARSVHTAEGFAQWPAWMCGHNTTCYIYVVFQLLLWDHLYTSAAD